MSGQNICLDLDDESFVETSYLRFLGRQPDSKGKADSLEALRRGISRLDFIHSLATSPEYCTALARGIFGSAELPNLRELRPERYRMVHSLNGEQTPVFVVNDATDYDWLESMIIQYGYYDRPGVWSLAVDPDKKVIAETVGHFKPQRVLELGCSTGAVLKLLLDEKIDAYGVEISHMALALAYVETRHRIFYGDLLQLDLGMDFDFILGMDVFEHLNPNKIGSYLRRCHALLQDDGFLLTNIPVFGNDPIFGEVFPIYLNSWIEDAAESGLFSTIHVSASGWPLNGHLIWAMTSWWQTHFENAGFTRAVDIEAILHDIYDPFFASSAPARRSFFVWQKQPAGKIRATATRDRLAKIRAEVMPDRRD